MKLITKEREMSAWTWQRTLERIRQSHMLNKRWSDRNAQKISDKESRNNIDFRGRTTRNLSKYVTNGCNVYLCDNSSVIGLSKIWFSTLVPSIVNIDITLLGLTSKKGGHFNLIYWYKMINLLVGSKNPLLNRVCIIRRQLDN